MNQFSANLKTIALVTLMSAQSNVFAQATSVDFDSEKWTLMNAKKVDHLGRKRDLRRGWRCSFCDAKDARAPLIAGFLQVSG